MVHALFYFGHTMIFHCVARSPITRLLGRTRTSDVRLTGGYPGKGPGSASARTCVMGRRVKDDTRSIYLPLVPAITLHADEGLASTAFGPGPPLRGSPPGFAPLRISGTVTAV